MVCDRLVAAGAGRKPRIRAPARKPSNFACVSCAPACNPAQVRPRSVACASKSMSPGRPHRPGAPAGAGEASRHPPGAQIGSLGTPKWGLPGAPTGFPGSEKQSWNLGVGRSYPCSGFRFPAQAFSYQLSGFSFQVFGFRFQVPDFMCRRSRTCDRGSELSGLRLRGVASQFPWPRSQTWSGRSPHWSVISRRWSLICNPRSSVSELRPRGVAA